MTARQVHHTQQLQIFRSLQVLNQTVFHLFKMQPPLLLLPDGEAVLKLAFRDGGNSLNDADDMPTIFKEFSLIAALSNAIPNWQNTIQSLALFNDSTGARMGTVTIGQQSITITGLNITAADNNYTTATLRLSLKSTNPVTEK